MNRTAYRNPDTSTVVEEFSLDELWLLQSAVRHEVAQQEQWKFPPASRELNDAIAAALLFCTECKEASATLVLSYGDLLVIDYNVQQSAKDVNGKLVGKAILLKTFSARSRLAYGDEPEAEEPFAPTKAEIAAMLAGMDIEVE